MNMSGTYLVNWTVMHTFDGGALAWRLFDLSLMAAAAIAMLVRRRCKSFREQHAWPPPATSGRKSGFAPRRGLGAGFNLRIVTVFRRDNYGVMSVGQLTRAFRVQPQNKAGHKSVLQAAVQTAVQDSPLFEATEEAVCASGAEFLILLTGMDETFSQVMNAGSSYRANQVVWDAKFNDIFVYGPEGRMADIDMKRFHDTARIAKQS